MHESDPCSFCDSEVRRSTVSINEQEDVSSREAVDIAAKAKKSEASQEFIKIECMLLE